MATARKTAPETPKSLLTLLGDKYDFGPVMNKRIKDTLTLPMLDPLLNPPPWLGVGPLRVVAEGETEIIRLGTVHGHTTLLIHWRRGTTILKAGCRKLSSEASARAHWRNNTSIISHEPRPNATALIDYAASICKHRGWRW